MNAGKKIGSQSVALGYDPMPLQGEKKCILLPLLPATDLARTVKLPPLWMLLSHSQKD